MPYIIIDCDSEENWYIGDTPQLALEALLMQEYGTRAMTIDQMQEVQAWFKHSSLKMYQLGPQIDPIFPEKIPEIEFRFIDSGNKVL